MTPIDKDGQWYNDPKADSTASVVSAARTTSGQSTSFSVQDIATIDATLNITAVSGTSPSLTLTLQVSDDNATWEAAPSGAWAAATAVSAPERTVSVKDWKFARWSWVITGTTPSFTFSVDALDKKGGVA